MSDSPEVKTLKESMLEDSISDLRNEGYTVLAPGELAEHDREVAEKAVERYKQEQSGWHPRSDTTNHTVGGYGAIYPEPDDSGVAP